jgi:MarR family transcriptional regulator, organic hydroperoxide resistance regulator
VAAVADPAVTHRLQGSIVDLQRITNSRKLHQVRAARAGVTITPVAGSVLRHIIEVGPARPALLAERMRMQPSALSRQLKVLEDEGCIERDPISGDGRGWLVRVTQRGRGIEQRLERADAAILAGQLRHWSAVELDTLNDLLDRLIHDLRAPAPAAHRKKAS